MKSSILQATSGFSLLEVMVMVALTTFVIGGGVLVLTRTVELERKTIVQSLADTEFAAGMQLGQNAPRLAPFVGVAAMGDCLHGNSGSGCGSFSGWHELPLTTGPQEPRFQTRLDLQGPCQPPKPCLVERTMRYHWVCSDTGCSALEVEVKALSNEKNRVKERTAMITIAKNQFSDRGQLKFHCDSAGQSLRGMDFSKLSDTCKTVGSSACETPQAFFVENGSAGDCQPELSSSCSEGFSKIGLDSGAVACAGSP